MRTTIYNLIGGKKLRVVPDTRSSFFNMYFGEALKKSLDLDGKGSCREGNADITAVIPRVSFVSCKKDGPVHQQCMITSRNPLDVQDVKTVEINEVHLQSIRAKATKQKAWYFTPLGSCAVVGQSCSTVEPGKTAPKSKQVLYCA